MKNVRVKVVENCPGNFWWYAICDSNRQLLDSHITDYKANAIRGAKSMAKRIGIKYDPEIIKQHGC